MSLTVHYAHGKPVGVIYKDCAVPFEKVKVSKGKTCYIADFPDECQVVHDMDKTIVVFEVNTPPIRFLGGGWNGMKICSRQSV